MKQKVGMEVSMNGRKSQTKALKIAAGAPGVESVALQGEEKNQIAVTGDGIDSIVLTKLLRKNVGYTKLVTVAPVEKRRKRRMKRCSQLFGHQHIHINMVMVCHKSMSLKFAIMTIVLSCE